MGNLTSRSRAVEPHTQTFATSNAKESFFKISKCELEKIHNKSIEVEYFDKTKILYQMKFDER